MAVAGSGGTGYKNLCRFILDAPLTNGTESVAALLTAQYGEGTAHSTGAITVHNMLTSATTTYQFAGSSGHTGLASHDSGTNWRIIHLEGYKQLCDFVLDAPLGTTSDSAAALLTAQYGEGTPHSTGAITVFNGPNDMFYGSSGTYGMAFHDSGTNWRILQLTRSCTT
jgi:hypothetical protein